MELVILAVVVAVVWGIDLIVRRFRIREKGKPAGMSAKGLGLWALLLFVGTLVSWTVGIRGWGNGGEGILDHLWGRCKGGPHGADYVAGFITFMVPALATLVVTGAAVLKSRKERSQNR